MSSDTGRKGHIFQIILEEISPEVKAFDTANKLIFINGSLVGTGAQAATVMTVAGKSPGTYPEGFCYGFLAGYFGTELKKAGYDGIVIEGSASEPVYISVQDQQVKILKAGSWWGKSAYQTVDAIIKEHGGDAKYITIGISGERKVRTAIALASFDSTLSCGFGAVMGSRT